MVNQTTSYKYRFGGALLGVAFHVGIIAFTFATSDAPVEGYRLLFTWYLPSIIVGLPWSIPGLMLEALIPGGSILGIMAAVCLNGYLVGWMMDAIANRGLRDAQQRQRALCRAASAHMNIAPPAEPSIQ